MIVGIDNGISGAACVLDPDSGDVVRFTAMPLLKVPVVTRAKRKSRKAPKEKEEIDIAALIRWLPSDVTLIAVEEPLFRAPSSQSMRSMGISFGKIMGACAVLGLPHERVRVGDWQAHYFGPRFAAGATKTLAARTAGQLQPGQQWIPHRCRTPHDGVIDAYLIGRFAWERKKNLDAGLAG